MLKRYKVVLITLSDYTFLLQIQNQSLIYFIFFIGCIFIKENLSAIQAQLSFSSPSQYYAQSSFRDSSFFYGWQPNGWTSRTALQDKKRGQTSRCIVICSAYKCKYPRNYNSSIISKNNLNYIDCILDCNKRSFQSIQVTFR